MGASFFFKAIPTMAVASCRAGRVLARPLFLAESKIDSRVFPEELPKAALHQYFVLSTAILVYSVATPSLAAMEPWLRHVTGFQMPIEHPTSGGQVRDKEAAVQQIFHLVRSTFFYLSALM